MYLFLFMYVCKYVQYMYGLMLEWNLPRLVPKHVCDHNYTYKCT